MEEVKVIKLLPDGLTKVDLGNDQRKQFLFPKDFLHDLARRCGCDCPRCIPKSPDQLS